MVVDGRVVREDVFQCLSRSEDSYRVVLTTEELLLQAADNVEVLERFSLTDLFGCHTLRTKKGPSDNSAFLCFYFYPKARRGVLGGSRWRAKTPIVFRVAKGGRGFEENLVAASKWKEDTLSLLATKFPKWRAARQRANGEISTDLSTQTDVDDLFGAEKTALIVSPYLLFLRRFFIILNPKSGQGQTVQLFHDKIHPMLIESGVKADLVVTERSGHAKSLAATTDFKDFDGIVAVGGDGLLFEIVNGLRSRPDFPSLSNIPVGIISGGSGNGLARSIASYTGEDEDYLRNSVLSTSLTVARGKVKPVNVLKIEVDGKRIFSFLSVGWGLLPDIDIESEVLRFIGEIRFTLWALVRLVNLRTYEATLSFTPFIVDGPKRTEGPKEIISGQFVCIYAVCQKYIGSYLKFAPNATQNDGMIHLIYIKGDIGRLNAMKFLMRLDKDDHMNIAGVHYVPVKDFTIESEGGLKGTVTVDGEEITGSKISASLSPTPLNILSI